MADLTTKSKIGVGLLIPALGAIWILFGAVRDVEASIASERTNRERLEERVAWTIINNDNRNREITARLDRLDMQIQINSKDLTKIVAYFEGGKNAEARQTAIN